MGLEFVMQSKRCERTFLTERIMSISGGKRKREKVSYFQVLKYI